VGKAGCDERSRSELTAFLPAGGDRQIADLFRRHSSALPHHLSGMICVHLRDLRFLRCVRGWSLCLRVFVFALFSVVQPGAMGGIPNSEFRIPNYCRLRCAIMGA
jgi:hypothetical protein